MRLALLGLTVALTGLTQTPIPFGDFIQRVKHAEARDFLREPGFEVKDAAAFEQMRHYILKLYAGVHVRQSYSAGKQTIDCIPENEQPAMRRNGRETAAPPSSAGPQEPASGGCGGGTIPMRRITLEELTRFRTLDDYLSKAPGGGRAPLPNAK